MRQSQPAELFSRFLAGDIRSVAKHKHPIYPCGRLPKSKKTKCPRSGCPITNALEVLGDRWSLLIIRDLMVWNVHEFGALRDSGEGIATNILTDRLKTLAADGIINSIKHPTNGTKKLYYLTRKGKALLPLMREMVIWGDAHCEGSKAPPERMKPVIENGDEFMAGILANLETWEIEYLGKPAD